MRCFRLAESCFVLVDHLPKLHGFPPENILVPLGSLKLLMESSDLLVLAGNVRVSLSHPRGLEPELGILALERLYGVPKLLDILARSNELIGVHLSSSHQLLALFAEVEQLEFETVLFEGGCVEVLDDPLQIFVLLVLEPVEHILVPAAVDDSLLD